MDKTVKRSLMVIAIVIVIFGILWLVYDMLKKEPVDTTAVNSNLVDENTGLDNIINELFENVITNETEENTIKNTTKQEYKKDENVQNTNKDESTTESVTSREEKAISLVKKEWGDTDGVYFSNESIDASGRYIVSVRDKMTTNSLAFFVVNVDSELVTKR